jgi:MtaA/CmuA family methyltransferase
MAESLSSIERVRRRLNGEAVDRAPNFNIFMAFGAHAIGAKLSDYYLDYRTLVRANLAMLEEYELDLVQTISDPYREAVDFGLTVEFPEDGLPMRRKPLLVEPGDLKHLHRPDPATGRRMSDRLEAIRALREQVGAQVPVMGWVEGALAQANALRGDEALLTDLFDRPEWVNELLEMITDVEIAFARAQVEAGASIIGLGDAIASQVSPRMYRQFALPYEKRIFAEVRAMGALPRLHICGDTTKIVEDMGRSGAAIVDVDWMVDFKRAAQTLESLGAAVCGNVDPVAVLYQGQPEAVYQAVTGSLRDGGPRCFIAAGCEIPDGTPPENLRAQIRAIRDFRPE